MPGGLPCQHRVRPGGRARALRGLPRRRERVGGEDRREGRPRVRDQPQGAARPHAEGAVAHHRAERVRLRARHGLGLPRHRPELQRELRRGLLRVPEPGLPFRMAVPAVHAVPAQRAGRVLSPGVSPGIGLHPVQPRRGLRRYPGRHPQSGDGEPLPLHAVPTERRGPRERLGHWRRLQCLRQPQLLAALHGVVRPRGLIARFALPRMGERTGHSPMRSATRSSR
ncbi:hypothetical protein PLANTIT3_80233 [Plantibacter sp. T3]|nr:hypothetical protein PLANTIT3_80233 [Plantibacter sp. T3]